MMTLTISRFVSIIALLLMLTAGPASANVQASSFGNIIDNQITRVTINPTTRNATISGMVTCSTPTEIQVYGVVRQSHGMSDHLAEYFGAEWVTCGVSPTHYQVSVLPGYELDQLKPGPVSSNTWAAYCDGSCYGYGADSKLPLRPAPSSR